MSPQRIRMFTMKNALGNEDDDDDETNEKTKKAFIVPNKIFPIIWRQKEHFDNSYSSNMRVSKFIQACRCKDNKIATQIIEAITTPTKASPTKSPFHRKPSSYRLRNKNISMGHMRKSEYLQEWTSCNIADDTNTTIQDYLLIACRYNLPELSQLIIEKNGDPQGEKEKNEFTPIYVSCLFGCDSIVSKVLAPHKIDVCETDISGCTPLHLMTLAGHKTEIDTLLELGADLFAEDEFGKLPLYYSYLARNREISLYLWESMSFLPDTVTHLNLSKCAMNFFPPDVILARFQNLEVIHYIIKKIRKKNQY